METFTKLLTDQIQAFKLNRQTVMLAHQAKLVALERDHDIQEALTINTKLGKYRWLRDRLQTL